MVYDVRGKHTCNVQPSHNVVKNCVEEMEEVLDDVAMTHVAMKPLKVWAKVDEIIGQINVCGLRKGYKPLEKIRARVCIQIQHKKLSTTK
jgi:hypothetical protein